MKLTNREIRLFDSRRITVIKLYFDHQQAQKRESLSSCSWQPPLFMLKKTGGGGGGGE